MDGLGLRAALSALLRLRPGGRPAMCAADSLAAHSRLTALLAAVFGLGLASRRSATASENRDGRFYAHAAVINKQKLGSSPFVIR